LVRNVASDSENGLHPLRIRSQRREADPDVSATAKGVAPSGRTHVLAPQAPIERRLDSLEIDHPNDVGEVPPRAPSRRKRPEPLEDGIAAAKPVIRPDDEHPVRCAL